jgi:hypothetical protein
MNMATIVENPTSRKAPRAYRAILRDEPGTLAKVDGVITFYASGGQVIDIEPEDCVWLTVLGEVGLSETQQLRDTMHGRAPRIACDRQMEVR